MIDSASANPWLGLNTYKENDRLYGRDREAEEVSDIIENNILTVIYGRSGIGKSSLLQAGIFPRLRYNDLLPVYIRLEHNSETEYISQIVSKIQNESEKSKTNLICSIDISSIRTLVQLAASVTAQDEFTLIPRNITLVFDQFEELFTLPDKAHRQAMNEFFSQLSEMLNNTDSEHALRIVICLREDYLYFLEQASVNVPSLKRNRYSLQGLTRGQGRDVICLPRKGLVSEELAENILDKIDPEHSDVIAPAILSLFMHELYEKGKGTITQENISLFGDHIISNFYENGMKSVSPVALAFLEDRLVTSDGYRHFISYNDALAHGVTAEELERLKQRRILTIEKGMKGQQLIEFSHDVLCPIVMRNRKERQLNEETERLRAKNAAIKRRQVFIISLVLITLGVVCIFAGMYIMMKDEREQMLANQSRFVAKEALELAQSGDYIKAMALVAEVHPKKIERPERPFTSEAYDALRILNDSTAQLERVIQLDSKLTDAVFSNTGKYLATKNGSKISIWDIKKEKLIANIIHEDLTLVRFSKNDNYLFCDTTNDPNHQIFSINSKKFITLNDAEDITSIEDISSDEKKVVATSYYNRTAQIYYLPTSECISTLKVPYISFSHARFSPDGKYIATLSEIDNAARIWDAETSQCLRKVQLPERGLRIEFSPDGKCLLIELASSEVLIIDTKTGMKKCTMNWERKEYDYETEFCQFSPDSKYILTTVKSHGIKHNGKAQIWDIESGKCLRSLKDKRNPMDDIDYAKFSSDNKYISTISQTGISIWDTSNFECIFYQTHISRALTAKILTLTANISSDNNFITVVSSSGLANKWKIIKKSYVLEDNLNEFSLFVRDNMFICAKDSIDKIKEQNKESIEKLGLDFENVHSIAHSPDKRFTIITSYCDESTYLKNTKIYNSETGECLSNISTHDHPLYIDFSKDTHKVISIKIFGRTQILNFYEPQELIDLTMKKLNNYTLSDEDRRTYYLE